MGRRRKDGDPFGLAGTRIVYRRGKFWYRHRGTDRFEDLGTDVEQAKRRARVYNCPGSNYGTVTYWFTLFLAACEQRVKAKLMAQRTVDDYTGYAAEGGPLLIFFGGMYPEDIKPAHVQLYIDKGAESGRPVPANRERACLSAMLSWLLRQQECPEGLLVNPCMKRSGVRRNKETARDRYVTHDEMREVWEVAPRSVRVLMSLTYRTLQRPESDIVTWNTNIVHETQQGRELRFVQNKTKRLHHIAVTPELDELIPPPLAANVRKIHEPLVRRLDGEPYTYSGISSLLKGAIAVANERRRARKLEPMLPFGFRDLKGKGATDMYYIDKVPIEQIQALCGHANKTTTETYIKARWRETAQPNQVKLVG